LTLFKSGEDALKVDREAVRAGSRHTRGHGLGFVNNPWGEKARQTGKATSRLDDMHWDMIKEHAYAHIGAAGDDSDEIAGNAASNPYAFIDLDW
jgi:hypothetical protein